MTPGVLENLIGSPMVFTGPAVAWSTDYHFSRLVWGLACI